MTASSSHQKQPQEQLRKTIEILKVIDFGNFQGGLRSRVFKSLESGLPNEVSWAIQEPLLLFSHTFPTIFHIITQHTLSTGTHMSSSSQPQNVPSIILLQHHQQYLQPSHVTQLPPPNMMAQFQALFNLVKHVFAIGLLDKLLIFAEPFFGLVLSDSSVELPPRSRTFSKLLGRTLTLTTPHSDVNDQQFSNNINFKQSHYSAFTRMFQLATIMHNISLIPVHFLVEIFFPLGPYRRYLRRIFAVMQAALLPFDSASKENYIYLTELFGLERIQCLSKLLLQTLSNNLGYLDLMTIFSTEKDLLQLFEFCGKLLWAKDGDFYCALLGLESFVKILSGPYDRQVAVLLNFLSQKRELLERILSFLLVSDHSTALSNLALEFFFHFFDTLSCQQHQLESLMTETVSAIIVRYIGIVMSLVASYFDTANAATTQPPPFTQLFPANGSLQQKTIKWIALAYQPIASNDLAPAGSRGLAFQDVYRQYCQLFTTLVQDTASVARVVSPLEFNQLMSQIYPKSVPPRSKWKPFNQMPTFSSELQLNTASSILPEASLFTHILTADESSLELPEYYALSPRLSLESSPQSPQSLLPDPTIIQILQSIHFVLRLGSSSQKSPSTFNPTDIMFPFVEQLSLYLTTPYITEAVCMNSPSHGSKLFSAPRPPPGQGVGCKKMQQRFPVLGPGERDPVDATLRTSQRKGVEARQPLNDTLFRKCERYFKTRSPCPSYDQLVDGQFSDERLLSLFPDLEISYISHEEIFGGKQMPAVEKHFLSDSMDPDVTRIRVIRSRTCPGMIYIPNPFSWSAQKKILKCIFKEAINPPCLSNLDPFYHIPLTGLWPLLLDELSWKSSDAFPYSITRKESDNTLEGADVYAEHLEGTDTPSRIPTKQEHSLLPLRLVRKLRWVTLGYQYDWTSKEYIWNAASIPFPPFLQTACKAFCSLLGWHDYAPEAGIINYYQLKDSLTGHVDRSERNETAPLVSYSFGCDAIFLLGGPTRDDPVLPFRLRSGDFLIMSGPCRRNYHGVPRIIEGSDPPALIQCNENDLEDQLLSTLIRGARVNLNVRQVW